MKRIILLIAVIFTFYAAMAQDTSRVTVTEKEEVKVSEDSVITQVQVNDKEVVTISEDSVATRVKVIDKEVVTVIEDSLGTRVRVGDQRGIEVITNSEGDTVRIRIGRRIFKVVDGEDGTHIRTSREPKECKEKHGKKKFPGTWGGVELGANMFHLENYSMYEYDPSLAGFFDINTPKSINVNLNFAEFSFSNKQNNFALVTGMGVSFMDYRFDSDMSIKKNEDTGIIIPVELSDDAEKSKLAVSYLTVPMILQVATPLKMKLTPLILGAGIIGGLNIGSHTKIKYPDAKAKERRSFQINPLKYDFTGRIGMGPISLYANLGMTSLFKARKGPDIRPLTVGVTFNFD